MKSFIFWFWTIVIFGIVWNVFGVYQFFGTLHLDGTTKEVGVMVGNGGLSASDLVYPLWMTIAFAIGVFGGLIGSILLAFKKKSSHSIFLISLLGYIVLYIGDITQGVFEALGMSQVIVLSFVVAVSAGLLWFSSYVFKNNKV